jgi:hypothetical protein
VQSDDIWPRCYSFALGCHDVVTCHHNFDGRRCTRTDVNLQVTLTSPTAEDPRGRYEGAYGSEGWGFESLRAHSGRRRHADTGEFAGVSRCPYLSVRPISPRPVPSINA